MWGDGYADYLIVEHIHVPNHYVVYLKLLCFMSILSQYSWKNKRDTMRHWKKLTTEKSLIKLQGSSRDDIYINAMKLEIKPKTEER